MKISVLGLEDDLDTSLSESYSSTSNTPNEITHPLQSTFENFCQIYYGKNESPNQNQSNGWHPESFADLVSKYNLLYNDLVYGQLRDIPIFSIKNDRDLFKGLEVAKVFKQPLKYCVYQMIPDLEICDINEVYAGLFESQQLPDVPQSKNDTNYDEKLEILKSELTSNIDALVESRVKEHVAAIKDELRHDMMKELKAQIEHSLVESVPSKSTDPIVEAASMETLQKQAMAAPIVDDQLTIHSAICDLCDFEIIGIRYKCAHCEDFDLCESCESIKDVHDPTHIFLKIKTPLKQKLDVKLFQTSDATEPQPESTPTTDNIPAYVKPFNEPVNYIIQTFSDGTRTLYDDSITIQNSPIFRGEKGSTVQVRFLLTNEDPFKWSYVEFKPIYYSHPEIGMKNFRLRHRRISPKSTKSFKLRVLVPNDDETVYTSTWRLMTRNQTFGPHIIFRVTSDKCLLENKNMPENMAANYVPQVYDFCSQFSAANTQCEQTNLVNSPKQLNTIASTGEVLNTPESIEQPKDTNIENEIGKLKEKVQKLSNKKFKKSFSNEEAKTLFGPKTGDLNDPHGNQEDLVEATIKVTADVISLAINAGKAAFRLFSEDLQSLSQKANECNVNSPSKERTKTPSCSPTEASVNTPSSVQSPAVVNTTSPTPVAPIEPISVLPDPILPTPYEVNSIQFVPIQPISNEPALIPSTSMQQISQSVQNTVIQPTPVQPAPNEPMPNQSNPIESAVSLQQDPLSAEVTYSLVKDYIRSIPPNLYLQYKDIEPKPYTNLENEEPSDDVSEKDSNVALIGSTLTQLSLGKRDNLDELEKQSNLSDKLQSLTLSSNSNRSLQSPVPSTATSSDGSSYEMVMSDDFDFDAEEDRILLSTYVQATSQPSATSEPKDAVPTMTASSSSLYSSLIDPFVKLDQNEDNSKSVSSAEPQATLPTSESNSKTETYSASTSSTSVVDEVNAEKTSKDKSQLESDRLELIKVLKEAGYTDEKQIESYLERFMS